MPIQIAVTINARGARCGCCALIDASGPDDAPVRCTAFDREFGPTDVDAQGMRLRLQACRAAEVHSITTLDSEDQWQAFRIGRDCREAGILESNAVARLHSVYPQPGQRHYFEAGFNGQPCPALTAPNPV